MFSEQRLEMVKMPEKWFGVDERAVCTLEMWMNGFGLSFFNDISSEKLTGKLDPWVELLIILVLRCFVIYTVKRQQIEISL